MRCIESGGVALRMRVEGDGPAVLLLHGLGEDLDVWWERGWAQALRGRRRVVAFDARGHGASTRPRDPRCYDVAARVADALAVLDAAGCDAADVVGYSMGGWTALLLARDAPARLRSVVAGGAPAVGQSLEGLRRAIGAGLGALLHGIERQCGPLPDAATARFLANDRDALAAVCADDRPALVDRLAGVGVPAMFYVAERDPLRPAVEAGARALRWPCAVVPGCDHFDLAVRGAALPVVEGFLDRAVR
jgi:pimeloyl-ACP methyl ester carboxylesterase